MPDAKISILLATKDRPQKLKKIVQYYAKADFRGMLVICDASASELCEINQQIIQAHRDNLKIAYHACMDFEHAEHLPLLMSMVTTPYAVYLSDNGIIVPKALTKCCEFLEDRMDYSAAGGNIIHMRSDADGCIKKAGYLHFPDLEHEDALERWSSYMRRPHELIFFVFRMELWRQAFQENIKFSPNDRLTPSAMLLFRGKIKRLECLYLVLFQNEDAPVDSAFLFKHCRHWPLYLKALQEKGIPALLEQGVVSSAKEETMRRELMLSMEEAPQADEGVEYNYGNILSSLLHNSNPFYSDFIQVYSLFAQDNSAVSSQTGQITGETLHDMSIEEAALLNQRGEELFNNGDIDGALDKFNRALIAAPDFTAAYNNLGVAYWQTGQVQKAIDCLAKGFAIDAYNRDLIINLGNILTETGQVYEAKKLYELYLARYSDDRIILDAYSSLIRKINISTANAAASDVSGKGKNSCLFINLYYHAFMIEHYRRNPQLARDTYKKQKESLIERCFGDCDFYSEGLKAAAWDAEDLIINCWPLQQAWARENSYDGEGMNIAVEQIRRAKPDVIYLQDLSVATKEFLSIVRPYTRLVVGQIASPVPPQASLLDVDIIFSSFPHFVERFRKAGINAYYQPLSFEPRVLDRLNSNLSFNERKYAATFVGGVSMAHGKGTQFLEQLAQLVPIDFWGYGAESLSQDSPIRRQHHGEAWGLDMFAVLSQSRIAVNRHIDVSENYANNMRLFEATGCGALLITEYKDNLNELFEIGKEVVAYRSPEECADLIRFYVANPHEAEVIAKAGQKRTLDEHSIAKRMKQTAHILKSHLH